MFLTLSLAAAQSPLEQFQFKPVGEISIRADGPVDEEFVRSLIEITPNNDVLTISRIRKAIELLYETGNFTNVLVDANMENDHVHLTFILRLVYRFEYIHLKGTTGISNYKIMKRVRLRKLEPFAPEKVLKGRMDILDVLHENGYYQAEVTPDVLLHRTSKRAEVTYTIKAGAPAIVGTVEFIGDSFFSSVSLLKVMDSKPGKRYREYQFTRDQERIEAIYDRNGFLEHNIQVTKKELDSHNHMNLEFNIAAGKQLILRTKGFEVSEENLRSVLPIWTEHSYNDDTLEDGKRNLITYLQKKGYYDATVQWERTQSMVSILIEYTIEPGTRYGLDHILITGNKNFPSSEIKEVMRTRESGTIKTERLVTEVFDKDRDRVIRAYHERGFLFARFLKDEVIRRPNGNIDLSLEIDEGPRSIVSEIRLRGNQAITSEEFLKKFQLKVGEPVSETKAKTDSNFIVALYSDRGYARVQVKNRLQLSQDKQRALIIYDVTEGDQYFVDRIVISGNYRTDRDVILRRLYFAPRDPLSLRRIADSQSHLYELQIFDRVEVDIPRPDSLSRMQDVHVRLTEAKPYTISYGFGYQTFDHLRGIFNISNRNLFGTAQGLALQLKGSVKEGRALITYTDPHLIFEKANSTLNLLAEKRNLRKTFAYREYSAIFNAEKKLNKESGELAVGTPAPVLKSLFVQYRFSDIDTTGTPTLDPEDRRFLAIHISSFSGGVVRDARDNGIDPTVGNYLSTSLEWASSYFGSNTDFLKSFNEYQYYTPFHGIVFVNALRLGLAKGFRDTNNLPLSQRFFAGGCHSIRGFEQDTCGPLDKNGEPTGGNSLFVWNLESRFPVYGAIGGLVFFDMGNVFRKINGLGSLEKMRETAGLGLRYRTPIGPITVNWGYKLDRRPGESASEICFSVGNAF